MSGKLINFKGKNILIAGGSGLVGTNLRRRIKYLGGNVLSTYFTKKPNLFSENYRLFDFTNFDECMEATKEMDYVFICATVTHGVKEMKENPTASILPNLKINAGLLEACHMNKVDKVVFISSSTVYHMINTPIREDQLDLNMPPYDIYLGVGWFNRYLEQLAGFYHKSYGAKIGFVSASSIY